VIEKQKIIKIGVSGHRFLDNTAILKNSVRKVFSRIFSENPGCQFELISPLAIGADQLAAECALEFKKVNLVVLLPGPEQDFLNEYSDEERKSFLSLFDQRKHVIYLPEPSKKVNLYLNMGRFLLSMVDYLIVLWNGKPARGSGGTAQIARLGEKKGLPVAWVRTHNAIPINPVLLQQELIPGSVVYWNWNAAHNRVN